MPGGGTRGLLRIRPFIYPPVLAKPIEQTGASGELPKAFAFRTRVSQGSEGALGSAEVNQVLRQTFFSQDSGNHRAIPPGVLHANLESLAAALLEVVNIAQHKVIDRQGQVVRTLLNGLLRK